jgi:curved DNA-binding protein CbpA
VKNVKILGYDKRYTAYKNRKNEYLKALKLLNLNVKSTEEEIKRKYKELAKVYHPDKYSNDDKKQEVAKRNFQKLNYAYDIIKKYKKFK